MSEEDNDVSESGAPIFRYTDGEKEWESAHGEECIEEISDHIEEHIGKIDMVFHELLSDTVHIDVHHVRPTSGRPFHTLVTSGMSDLPMKTPDDIEGQSYAELMITLPADWKVDEVSFKDHLWYWPIHILKYLARFPHKYDTWLGWGHSMPNGDPAESYAENTDLCGVLLLPSPTVPKEFYQLEITPQKVINFFSVFPLYQEEMDLKLKSGTDALIDRFEKYDVMDDVDIKRRNVAKKRFIIF